MVDVDFAITDTVRSDGNQVVLPHFDAIGEANDAEAVLGPEVVQDGEKGILGLETQGTVTPGTGVDHSQ